MVRAIDGHGLRMTSSPPWPAGTGSPSLVTISGTIPKKGRVAEPGLVGTAPGMGANHDGSGLCLPPCVDNRAASFAYLIAIPHPCFGIDGLTDSTKQAQRIKFVFLQMLIAPL